MRASCLAVLLLLPVAAHSRSPAGPGWGSVEGGRLYAKLQSDEEGDGKFGAINIPISEYWMAVGRVSTLDAHFTNPAIPVTERYRNYSAGLGLHDNWGRAHGYATLGYAVSKRHTEGAGSKPFDDNHYGAVLDMGVRILARPWLELEPAGSVESFGATLRFSLGLRVLPHLWLVGGYAADTVFSDENGWTAGLRLTLSDATSAPVKPRGTAPLSAAEAAGDEPGFAAGQVFEALRTLRLQARPRFGAPETVVVPKGATLALQKAETNDFGNWWYVSVDGKEGWLRESELR